jgi:hypothetical protein
LGFRFFSHSLFYKIVLISVGAFFFVIVNLMR